MYEFINQIKDKIISMVSFILGFFLMLYFGYKVSTNVNSFKKFKILKIYDHDKSCRNHQAILIIVHQRHVRKICICLQYESTWVLASRPAYITIFLNKLSFTMLGILYYYSNNNSSFQFKICIIFISFQILAA